MRTTVEVIQEKLQVLKKAELRVATHVLDNLHDITELTITELAERAQTSEPTVIRFCRKIGLKGYTDLRLSLAREIPVSDFVNESITPDDSPVKILHKTFKSNIEALSRNLPGIDSVLFDRSVEMLSEAAQICFYAFGGSGMVVQDAHHKFFRLGIPCQVCTDAHMQFMSASLLNENSVVIAVSLKGSTRDLVESVNIARDTGAKVIGLIGTEKSPLGKACDFAITVDVDEVTMGVFPLATRLTLLAVLDALYLSVTMRKIPIFQTNLNKVKKTLALRNY